MSCLYAQAIARWERGLAQQDPNRVVHPFEWGLEWLERKACADDPSRQLRDYVRSAVQGSDEFFAYERPRDFALDGSHLTFTTPLGSPHPENNIVHADFFPAGRDRTRAVVVLPQWNADANGHVALCRVLNRCGLSALRMSLAYHDRRMPAGHQRAECHVSSNLGRTIHASRQSVIDARACLDWLQAQGYERLGILGTSLGSCIAFIVAAHDARVKAGVFNHVSMYFGDVVWTGLATRHVREGLGDAVTQDRTPRLLERHQPRDLCAPAGGPGSAQPADLGQLRYQLPAPVLAAVHRRHARRRAPSRGGLPALRRTTRSAGFRSIFSTPS